MFKEPNVKLETISEGMTNSRRIKIQIRQIRENVPEEFRIIRQVRRINNWLSVPSTIDWSSVELVSMSIDEVLPFIRAALVAYNQATGQALEIR